MITFWKQMTRRMSLGLCALIPLMLLAACRSSDSIASSPTPAVAMQTYTGTSFTVKYPVSWKVSASSQGSSNTIIKDNVSNSAFTISTIPDPQNLDSANTIADTSTQVVLKSPNLKKSQTVSVPATVTLNGVTWVQRKITYTTLVHGQDVPTTIILLVTTHPAHAASTQAYRLVCGGPTATFERSSTQIFQPMLRSFKFTT
jgi:hypothetical protein